MEPEINHDLDTDGDVLLVLQNLNEPFAVWDEEEDWELPRSKRRGTTSLGMSIRSKSYRFRDPALESHHRSLVILRQNRQSEASPVGRNSRAVLQVSPAEALKCDFGSLRGT